MTIFLLGYMGSGKTTAGKKLATMLGYGFTDLDSMIEIETGRSVNEWFEMGEEKFREIESLVLRQTEVLKNRVIATGGGTPCFHDHMNWMKEHGVVVYIKMTPAGLFHRLTQSKNKRPLLSGKNETELLNYITTSLGEREQFYSQAHCVVEGENLDLKSLVQQLKSFGC